MTTPCLQVSDVVVRFGGLTALDNVSFEVAQNEIVGLIGPNGAGKTTLLNVIAGLIRPSAGQIRINGRDCGRHSVHRRARQGISRTFQRVGLFPELTIGQHLQLAADAKGRPARRGAAAASVLTDPEQVRQQVGLDLPGSSVIVGLPLGTLRLIELAMGIAAVPEVLMLDEPFSGLVGHERRHMGDLLCGLRDQGGVGIVLVEHDIDSVARLVDRMVVLDFGKKIADGAPADVLSDSLVRTAYFGHKEAVR
jgi:branched-chain amino acid transport system ATP-binding protein